MKKITLYRITREAVRTIIVLAAVLFINLPSAWADNGHPLSLVVLAMMGTASFAFAMWIVDRYLTHRIITLAMQEQHRREAPAREAERRRAWAQSWHRWFCEQEQYEA